MLKASRAGLLTLAVATTATAAASWLLCNAPVCASWLHSDAPYGLLSLLQLDNNEEDSSYNRIKSLVNEELKQYFRWGLPGRSLASWTARVLHAALHVLALALRRRPAPHSSRK